MEGRNESLQNMVPPVAASFDPATGGWVDQNGHVPLGIDGLLFTSTIDLSGWTRDDFTFGTVQSQFQDPGVYLSNTASSQIEVMEFISDIPISEARLNIIKIGMGSTVPGMMYSQQDFSTIVYGSYRLYVPNSTLGLPNFLQLISSGSFGSKEPTASAMLYCYRIIKCTGAPGETLSTPALRIGLFGAFYQEGDLPHMMRLKRSYELQQLVD